MPLSPILLRLHRLYQQLGRFFYYCLHLLLAVVSEHRQQKLFTQHAGALIGLMLKEPESNGRRILQLSLRADSRLQHSYYQLLRNKNAALELVKRLCVGNMDALNHWLPPNSPRILVSAHTSHYLLGVMVLLHQVRQIGDVMIIKRKSNSVSEQLFMDFAADYCDSLHTVQPDLAGIKAALKHLRGGGCLIMMIDVPLHLDVSDSVRVDFFGQPLLASTAIARLALKTCARVVPAAMIKNEDHLAVNLRQPFIATKELTAAAITQRLMSDVEHWVGLSPHDWMLWGHFLYWHQCSIEGTSQDDAKSPKMTDQMPTTKGESATQGEHEHQITHSAA